MAGIIGIQAGSSGLFIASLVPGNGTLQSGPVFSTTDAKVALRTTSDPYATVATVAADNTAASFNLAIMGRTTSGEISNTFAIPILK